MQLPDQKMLEKARTERENACAREADRLEREKALGPKEVMLPNGQVKRVYGDRTDEEI